MSTLELHEATGQQPRDRNRAPLRFFATRRQRHARRRSATTAALSSCGRCTRIASRPGARRASAAFAPREPSATGRLRRLEDLQPSRPQGQRKDLPCLSKHRRDKNRPDGKGTSHTKWAGNAPECWAGTVRRRSVATSPRRSTRQSTSQSGRGASPCSGRHAQRPMKLMILAAGPSCPRHTTASSIAKTCANALQLDGSGRGDGLSQSGRRQARTPSPDPSCGRTGPQTKPTRSCARSRRDSAT